MALAGVQRRATIMVASLLLSLGALLAPVQAIADSSYSATTGSPVSSFGSDVTQVPLSGIEQIPLGLPCTKTGLNCWTTPADISAYSQSLTTASGFFNLNATNLSHIRTSFANVRAGTGRGLVLTVTDSTGVGTGAGTGGTNNLNGAYPKGWVPNLATLLNGTIPTVFQSLLSSQATSVAYGAYDTRVTLGANWGLGTGTLAGNSFRFTSGGAVNNLTFTPTAAFDTVIPCYITFGGDGSATINVDGGASLGTLNGNVASGFVCTPFTVTKATHTINIVPNNNGQFELVALRTYDSTTPAIDFMQAGAVGAKTASFDSAAAPFSPLNVIKAFAPSLTIISLTINDSNAPTTALATYTTQLQDIITAAKVSGDCMLVPGPPSNTVQATNGTLAQFVAVNRALAVSNNCTMVDMTTRWVSYAVTNPLMPYFDNLHPEAQGYWDMGLAIYQAITMTNSTWLLWEDLHRPANDNLPGWLQKKAA